MKKLNITIGRFMPMTQGHLNMINEGDAPCIVYRINSSNKEILRTRHGIKIGSKSYTNDCVNNVIKFIDTPEGDLTEQEKELLKRPFTNELIDKELDIVKKSNKNIIDVVPVVNVYDALGKYNKFITEHSDKYEVGDWMCGDDRKESYEKNVEGFGKYEELEYEFRSGKTLPNILIGKLKVNTGKGRTEGVSGTAVRKALLNKDKAGFEKIMPKGVGIMFDDFVDAFNNFKEQLQNIIKEHKMMTLKEYIIQESLKEKVKGWIEKFKKQVEPKKIFTEADLEEFKDKTVTEEDVDKIIEIREKIDKNHYLFTNKKNNENYNILNKLSYKQAILDYAYLNFENRLNEDKFGERHCELAFRKACEDNDEHPSNVSAGYYALPVLGRYSYGWSCAENLNLKCEKEIKVNFKL